MDTNQIVLRSLVVIALIGALVVGFYAGRKYQSYIDDNCIHIKISLDKKGG
jgi:uncharacterized protein YneF (UPF0154 family)